MMGVGDEWMGIFPSYPAEYGEVDGRLQYLR